MDNFSMANSYSFTYFQATNMICREFKAIQSWSHMLDFLHYVNQSDLPSEKVWDKACKEAAVVRR